MYLLLLGEPLYTSSILHTYMLIELYILYTIIAFSGFYVSLYHNKGIHNIFIWPVVILMFSMLMFSSYNIQYGTIEIFKDQSLFYFNLALVVLSFVLFGWDLYDKFTSGEIF